MDLTAWLGALLVAATDPAPPSSPPGAPPATAPAAALTAPAKELAALARHRRCPHLDLAPSYDGADPAFPD